MHGGSYLGISFRPIDETLRDRVASRRPRDGCSAAYQRACHATRARRTLARIPAPSAISSARVSRLLSGIAARDDRRALDGDGVGWRQRTGASWPPSVVCPCPRA